MRAAAPSGPVLVYLSVLAEKMAGRWVPGGCDHCQTEQRFTEQDPGVFALTVAHDPGCPVLAGAAR